MNKRKERMKEIDRERDRGQKNANSQTGLVASNLGCQIDGLSEGKSGLEKGDCYIE